MNLVACCKELFSFRKEFNFSYQQFFSRGLTILCLTILLFLGCTNTEKTNGEIEFWTLSLSPFFDEYIHSVIDEYEKKHPGIKIKWVDIPYDAAQQKLLAAFASGSPPDVVNLSTDFLSKFNKRNLLCDISSYLPIDSLHELYLPFALEDCEYEKKIIGIPWYLSTYCVIYNTELLSAAGYMKNDVPKSFSEAIHFIREYKKKTGKFAFFWNIGKDSYLPMMLGSEGYEMTNSGFTEAKLNSKEITAALQEWVTLYKEGYLPRESVTATGSTIVEPYQSGNVAFLFTGPVFLKRIKDNAPAVYAATGVSSPLTGKTGAHELAAMSLSVANQSLQKQQAIDFILYLTNAKNQIAFCQKATIYPSIKTALQDSFFLHSDNSPEGIAKIEGAKLLPSAKRLRRYLLHSQHDKLQQIFEEAVQEACLTERSIAEILAEANAEWNRLLKKR